MCVGMLMNCLQNKHIFYLNMFKVEIQESGSLNCNIMGHIGTLMTSQGFDTVTSIFKCDSSNTIKSLRLLKMAWFS